MVGGAPGGVQGAAGRLGLFGGAPPFRSKPQFSPAEFSGGPAPRNSGSPGDSNRLHLRPSWGDMFLVGFGGFRGNPGKPLLKPRTPSEHPGGGGVHGIGRAPRGEGGMSAGFRGCKGCDFLTSTLRQVFVGILDQEVLVVAYLGRAVFEEVFDGFETLGDLLN